MRKSLLFYMFLVSLIAYPVILTAQIIAYDPFDYDPGLSIEGLNGGEGWNSDYHNLNSTSAVMTTVADGLTFPALVTNAGALKIETGDNEGSKIYRKIDANLYEPNSSVWVSYIFQSENDLGGGGQLWLQPIGGTTSTGEWSGYGWHWSSTFKSIGDGSNQGPPIIGGIPFLLVAHFECTDLEIIASYWANPAPGNEPSIDDAFTSYNIGTPGAGVDSLALWAGYGNETVYIDELRLGHQFEDVAPLGSGGYDKYQIGVQLFDIQNNPVENGVIETNGNLYYTDAAGYTVVDSVIEGQSMEILASKDGYWGSNTAVYGNGDQTVDLMLSDIEMPTDNPKVILYTPTHPDDELFGATITFSKYCKLLGHTGYYVFTTMGQYYYGTSGCAWEGMVRRDEGERSANYVEADARFLSFEDGGVVTTGGITERMCRMIREIQPDIVITHASNGEYGHAVHVKTSNGVTQAVIDAADPTKYPEQLEEGLQVWDTPKFYRQNANYNGWESNESITTVIPGVVGPISELGDKTIREYAVHAMEHSHYTATAVFGGFDWGNTYPVPNEHSLHLARLAGGETPPASENTIFDGLSEDKLQSYSFIKDWILLGPYFGTVNDDFTSGEAGLDPEEGDIENEKVWTAYELESYALGTDLEINNQGMENRSNIDLKEFFGYRPAFASDAVGYAFKNYNVSNDTMIALGLMAHDYYKIYVNGELVRMRDEDDGYMLWDYEDRIPIQLTAGDNRILIKTVSRSSMSGNPWNVIPAYDNTPYHVANVNARAWSFSLKVDLLNDATLSEVTFNVTDNSLTAIQGAAVSFNNTVNYTDASGMVTVPNVVNSVTEYTYIVEKEGFNSDTGTVVVDESKTIDIVLIESSSISETALMSFQMYPNPASDKLTISLTTAGENEIAIYDITGKEVYRTNTSSNEFALDLSKFQNGVYMVKVAEHVQKLVIK